MKKIMGTMRLPEGNEEIKKWLREAKKIGIEWLDTAWVYGRGEVEKQLGIALEELKKEGIEFKIQTKIWTSDFKRVREAFNDQLKSLKMKKVDSLLLHRPSFNLNDDIKAWKILVELQKEGLTKHIGVSNYEKDMIIILEKESGKRPEINQIELSPTNFREDRVDFCKKMNIEIQSWSSFGKDPKKVMNSEIIKKIAKKKKASEATVVSSFLTTQGIIPMHASHNQKHLLETIMEVSLTKQEVDDIKKLNVYDNKFEELYPY